MRSLPLPVPFFVGLALSAWGCRPGTLACGGPGAPDGFCPAAEGLPSRPGQGDALDSGVPRDVPPVIIDLGRLLPDLPTEPEDIPVPRDLGAGCALEAVGRGEAEPSGGSGGPFGTSDLTLEAGGGLNHYRLFVPPCYDGSRPFGLAVVFHAANGNRDYLHFKWGTAARDREYIVALPLAQPTYDNQYLWTDDAAMGRNKAFVKALIPELEARYHIDRKDTVVAGLGAGANFAEELVLADDEAQLEYALVVNPGFYDARLEPLVKVFVVTGKETPGVSSRPFSSHFRYLHVPELGPFYPGPPYPPRPDDPGVTAITNEDVIDWFHFGG